MRPSPAHSEAKPISPSSGSGLAVFGNVLGLAPELDAAGGGGGGAPADEAAGLAVDAAGLAVPAPAVPVPAPAALLFASVAVTSCWVITFGGLNPEANKKSEHPTCRHWPGTVARKHGQSQSLRTDR